MRGRKKVLRKIGFWPEITYFKPAGIPLRELSEVVLTLDEVEALRLAELEDLEQEQAAKKMGVSRITFLRILHCAHKKITEGLIYGKAIKLEGGVIMPNENPQNQSPQVGRTWGRNVGRGQGLGGSEICICPKCNAKFPHQRGIPCIEIECPKCKLALRGKFCQ